MSERRQPLGRIVAKNRNDNTDKMTVATIWPGRWEGQHQFALQARTQVKGDWVNLPVKLIVEHPDGDIEITGGKEGSHFLDYYPNEQQNQDF